MKWTALSLRILLALAFTASAVLKLLDHERAASLFANYGYPGWSAFAVALLELAGALGLLISRSVEVAVGTLIALMLAAIYTHFSHGDSLATAIPALVLLILLALLALLRRRERALTSL